MPNKFTTANVVNDDIEEIAVIMGSITVGMAIYLAVLIFMSYFTEGISMSKIREEIKKRQVNAVKTTTSADNENTTTTT